jgi:uncharacterized cupredoxin-like copper-binding protein
MKITKRLRFFIPMFIGLVVQSGPVAAHGTHNHDTAPAGSKERIAVAEQTDWGIAGNPKNISRTIRIEMNDKMRFSPDTVSVRLGETIRFDVRNAGKVLHEMVIGTRQELDAHAEMMKKHPSMEHDEAYMAHVAPGKRGEMVWLFNRPGEFEFACLIPGHYEAGMRGKIRVGL